MKRFFMAALAAFALWCVPAGAQTQQPPFPRVDGDFIASRYAWDYGQIKTTNSVAAAAGTIILNAASVTLRDGSVLYPFSITAPITIDAGTSVSETVLPTAVTGCSSNAPNATCSITATFANAHGPSAVITSGTFGLQEAINDAVGFVGAGGGVAAGGGLIVVDKSWGGTTAQLNGTAAAGSIVTPFAFTTIVDKRNGLLYWNPTPTGAALAVPTTLTAQLACDATHQTCSDASVVGSASWGGTVFAAVAYMDCFGNEGPPSLTASWTSAASKAINIASPAASTGACGWIPYLSLSAGTYAQAYAIPPTATVCTPSTLTPVPSCAITNALYGTTGSTYGQTALFTKGGAQIITYPVNTGQHFTQLGSTAMTAVSQTPISNSSVSYAYAPSNRAGLPGITSANVINYAASGSSATTVPNAIATWTIPAGYFNYVGAEFRVTGKWTYTDGGDSSTNVYVLWDAAGTNTTTIGTTLCNVLDTATGTGAAYNGTYTCTVRVKTTGATGTALVNGYATQNLAAGATTLVRNGADIAVAASGSINLTAPARVTVYFIGTGATNNPGAQGLEATLEALN